MSDDRPTAESTAEDAFRVALDVFISEHRELRLRLAESQEREAELRESKNVLSKWICELEQERDRLRDFLQHIHDTTFNQSLQLLIKQALATKPKKKP